MSDYKDMLEVNYFDNNSNCIDSTTNNVDYEFFYNMKKCINSIQN